MPEFTNHRPGSVCYVELATSDPDTARKFYQNLFDWAITDQDMGPHGIYSQFLKGGKVTAAMYKLVPEQVEQGVPPHWDTYFAVDDCDASTKLATEIGGKLVAGPMDVADYGRLSILADPDGAVFCIWETKTKIGVELRDEINTICWSELVTTDPAAALSFYGQLFGWQDNPKQQDDSGDYLHLGAPGESPVVGVMRLEESMGPIPPRWANYFQVADCAASEKSAVEMGATVIIPTTPIPGMGFFCHLMDSAGAVFGLFMSTLPES